MDLQFEPTIQTFSFHLFSYKNLNFLFKLTVQTNDPKGPLVSIKSCTAVQIYMSYVLTLFFSLLIWFRKTL